MTERFGYRTEVGCPSFPFANRRLLIDGAATVQQHRSCRNPGFGCGPWRNSIVHTNSLDETLALPTEHAARIALRTQQILAHETGIANTVDPLAGSYFVERLTLDMEKGCWEYFSRLDALGEWWRRSKRFSAARNPGRIVRVPESSRAEGRSLSASMTS